nr:ATP-binding protein [Bradyrhizobium sp. 2]
MTDAALSADYTRVRRAVTAIARDLEKSGHESEAKELRALIRKRGVPLRASGYAETLPVDSKSRQPLVEERPWPETPIFLNEGAWRVFNDFITDVQHLDDLSKKGLSTRLGLLLSGPPGTGKTLLAGHLASQLNRPFYVLRLDSVISSLLGDTAKNVRSVFDYVQGKNALLLLDEMDALAKLRDDKNELGELKRVVNTVIQGLDELDPAAIVVGATNHPHLLDSAIWRRFPYKIELNAPDTNVRSDMWRYFLFADDDKDNIAHILSSLSQDISGADIESIGLTARRHAIIDKRPIDLGTVALAIVASQSGKSALPQRQPLDSEQKKSVATILRDRFKLSNADIGRLLNITRQGVRSYFLHDDGDS